MSKTAKNIVGVLVVVVIGVGIVWYMRHSASAPGGQNGVSDQPTQGQQSAAAKASLSQGSSDADLSQDTSTIDTQMNGLNSDNTSIDQGMNSK